MKQIKEFTGENARFDMLQDTINYYWGKPERKCVNEQWDCSYSPTKTSDGCAIGRHLPNDVCLRIEGKTAGGALEELPKWMQDLGEGFLNYLQTLHDLDYFVNKDEKSVFLRMKDFIPNIDQIQFPNE